jgi:hypothetical protein
MRYVALALPQGREASQRFNPREETAMREQMKRHGIGVADKDHPRPGSPPPSGPTSERSSFDDTCVVRAIVADMAGKLIETIVRGCAPIGKRLRL